MPQVIRQGYSKEACDLRGFCELRGPGELLGYASPEVMRSQRPESRVVGSKVQVRRGPEQVRYVPGGFGVTFGWLVQRSKWGEGQSKEGMSHEVLV